MLSRAVEETIRSHRMFEPGDRVLVAVSGGVDSVVLLHVLCALSDDLGLSLAVAHLNHGWRADASDDDARFVESLAEEAGIDVVVEWIAEEILDAHRALGREGAAREVRRRFLETAAVSAGATKIAVGHTASDRAETILFNLIRGAGTAGMTGIDAVNGSFVRPMIAVTRDDVLAYAEQNGLAWREDASNADLAFSRNRIRHRVLPELERLNPRAVEAICRAGDLASESRRAEEFLVSILWGDVVVCEEPGEVRLRRRELSELPLEVQHLILRDASRRARGDLDGIERCHVDSVLGLVGASDGHSEAHVPRLHARADQGVLSLSASPFPDSSAWETPLEIGRRTFPERGFSLDLKLFEQEADAPVLDPSDRLTEVADADRVLLPLRVRNRRIGDRFTPLGMEQPVKLKDFLINERVPFFDRDDVPLLCDGERILWVVGVRLSNEVRMTETTKRLLVMRMEPVS